MKQERNLTFHLVDSIIQPNCNNAYGEFQPVIFLQQMIDK